MLMFIAFQDHDLIAKVEDAVGPFATTVSIIHNLVGRIAGQSVEVQMSHQCILFGKAVRLECMGHAKLTLVVLVEDHDQFARDTLSLNEVLVFVCLMGLTTTWDIIHTVEGRFAADQAPRTRESDHPGFAVL